MISYSTQMRYGRSSVSMAIAAFVNRRGYFVASAWETFCRRISSVNLLGIIWTANPYSDQILWSKRVYDGGEEYCDEYMHKMKQEEAGIRFSNQSDHSSILLVHFVHVPRLRAARYVFVRTPYIIFGVQQAKA